MKYIFTPAISGAAGADTHCVENKILLVDDDTKLLEMNERGLRAKFRIDTAVGGTEGLRKLAACGPYAVVVADMQMPVMSGLEFLKRARAQSPGTVRMMLTGNSDLKTATGAVNEGNVFRYLNKPCPPTALAPMLEEALEHYRLMKAERRLLENTLGGAVKVLIEILSITDPVTFSRSNKLKEQVHDFAHAAYPHGAWEFELAAMLCQIGRVTTPHGLLEKERDGYALTGAEEEILSQIPEFGAQLLEKIPRLEAVAAIVRYQDKHFDGTGFPADSTFGDAIPLGSRILKVLHDLTDMESRAFSRAGALQQMRKRTGWYDPEVFATVAGLTGVLEQQPADPGNPQTLNIEELREGHILAENLRMSTGLLIAAADTTITPILLAKLLNFHRLDTIGDTLLVYAG